MYSSEKHHQILRFLARPAGFNQPIIWIYKKSETSAGTRLGFDWSFLSPYNQLTTDLHVRYAMVFHQGLSWRRPDQDRFAYVLGHSIYAQVRIRTSRKKTASLKLCQLCWKLVVISHWDYSSLEPYEWAILKPRV